MNKSHSHTRNIRTAFFLNLFFTIIEIGGGIWTNSMAILSDALHDLGDSLSLGLAWYLEKVSHKEKDTIYSFGYQRFSLLGALINGIVLIGGSAFIIYQAIPRLIEPVQPNAEGMLYFAILGVVINGIAAWKLMGGTSLNQRVMQWHMLEDVFGWLAVLIVSIVMMFYDIPILDPILSIVILLYVLFNVMKHVIHTMQIFLQAVPRDIDLEKIDDSIKSLEHVTDTHHTHVWTLEGNKSVMSIHVVTGDKLSMIELINLKKEIKSILRNFSIDHATVEIEFADESCYMEEE